MAAQPNESATNPPRESRRGAGPRAGDREFVQGFERGAAIIKAFGTRSRSLTVTQVAGHTGLTRAVARRYLLTLETLGYVTRDEVGFALTPRVLELGFAYLSTLTVADVARPYMLRVVETLQESCSLGVLDGPDVVYVGRVQAQRLMTTSIVVGSRLPAHATSLGKVLLAYLPTPRLEAYFATTSLQPLTERTIGDEATLRRLLQIIRRQGWSENDEESEKGIRTIAVPIFDRRGDAVAAINLSGHASRVTMRSLRRDHLPVLLDAAAEISRALGADVPRAAELATRRR
jgi:IclR family transcriptional regulator, pca regulon regulatory protein